MTVAVKIRVNVSGYAGPAVSLFCAFDPATDVLLVARSADYEGGDRDGFLKVTTSASDSAHDLLVQPDQTKEAIEAYFDLQTMGLLTLGDAAQRFNPASKIERDGLDESGPKYRVAPDITSGQVAVLIASMVARQQRAHAVAAEAFAEFELLSI